MSATDRIRAIHREATSSPWDEPWSVEAEADEHGYAQEYTVASAVGWIATFAYNQHLELFVQAKRHMEALCDLADDAREIVRREIVDGVGYCPACRYYSTAAWECGCGYGRVRDALARLDGEDGDG